MKKLLISSLLSCTLLLGGLMGMHKAAAATFGDEIAGIAQNYLGVPYKWGGTSPSGFDCSGFVNYTYKQMGISLPRTSAELYNIGQPVSKSSLQDGDLVFFSTYKAGPSHVGIYIGSNQFVHASDSGVKVDSLSNSYWYRTYYASKRLDASTKTGWVLSAGTWYYYDHGVMKTGWVNDGGTWYYLKANGAMATGWVKDGGTWYYLNSDGAMLTGWVKWYGDWYYLTSSGAMGTGWIKDGGAWYYLYSDGAMAKNTTIDGKVLGSDGAWQMICSR